VDIPPVIARYLRRHARPAAHWDALPPPAPGLKLCVVIPALAEAAELPAVLDALGRGSARWSETEVIAVVNNPAGADAAVVADNRATLRALGAPSVGPPVHALDRCTPGRALPPERAGVGPARRIGMDLALERLCVAGSVERAAIACLDADAPVAPGYLDALLAVFDSGDPPPGAVCACAHPIPDDPDRAAAILAYETWMRYFELGLALAGSPFSYPTIGSCLVSSAAAYAQVGGMPERQAGEDFYFAQKLIKLAAGRGLARLDGARVQPRARLSHRVPFGTGRALLRCEAEGPEAYRRVEPPEAFFELRRWFAALPAGYCDPAALRRAAGGRLARFLDAERAWPALARIRANQPDAARFAFAAHCWFDGLKCVRFAHVVERELGRRWAFDALAALLAAAGRRADFADLPRPTPPEPPLELLCAWLERLRGATAAGIDPPQAAGRLTAGGRRG
jgi:hypothetical protein